MIALLALALSCFCAGIMNTIAGGGSFLTFPALLLTGLNARAANMTSCLILFPMQVQTGYAGRVSAGGLPELSLPLLFGISLGGGLVGAGLLTLTPPNFFARLVPWLIMFATVVFAYGSFIRKPVDHHDAPVIGRTGMIVAQIGISIYGGYFGGGIGFLMLAALTLAGMAIKKAGTTKNILAAVMNIGAAVIFCFSPDIGWHQVAIGALASMAGGVVGMRVLHRVNEKILRIVVTVIGAVLTIAMFIF